MRFATLCLAVWDWLLRTIETPCGIGCEKQFAVLIGQAPFGLREQTGNPPFKERALATPIELHLIQKHGYSRDRVFE